MERIDYNTALKMIKSAKRKFGKLIDLEIKLEYNACALLWIKKKGYWKCNGRRRLWKDALPVAYVYREREYITAKGFDYRYDDEKLLNPTIKEISVDQDYSLFDDEFKKKLEHACEETVKLSKIYNMPEHERNFNIALKLAKENTYIEPAEKVDEFIVISNGFYNHEKDYRLVGLARKGDMVVLRHLTKIPKTKTILCRFTKEESTQIIGAHYYRQSQLRLMKESSKK